MAATPAARLAARHFAHNSELALAAIHGLSQPRKSLPCRFFYDAQGSALFEEITRLPEYYPTRTETGILRDHASAMIAGIPADGVIVEFGSGSSRKTEILLAGLAPTVTYVAIDVSQSALDAARRRLAARFPALDVRAVMGDFMHARRLPADLARRPKTGFFPGSTIGNFAPDAAVGLLADFKTMLAPLGRLIIGVDLKKDQETLVRAYDDSAGVTAAFNLNMLRRINHEVENVFDVSTFAHKAIYDPIEGRIEMHLVSMCDQEISLCGRRFRFRKGETIHTENSYKYSALEFAALARAAGWHPRRLWTDSNGLFSVHELTAHDAA